MKLIFYLPPPLRGDIPEREWKALTRKEMIRSIRIMDFYNWILCPIYYFIGWVAGTIYGFVLMLKNWMNDD